VATVPALSDNATPIRRVPRSSPIARLISGVGLRQEPLPPAPPAVGPTSRDAGGGAGLVQRLVEA
jgi:hypothetical protein